MFISLIPNGLAVDILLYICESLGPSLQKKSQDELRKVLG